MQLMWMYFEALSRSGLTNEKTLIKHMSICCCVGSETGAVAVSESQVLNSKKQTTWTVLPMLCALCP